MPLLKFWKRLSTAALTLAMLVAHIQGESAHAADAFAGRLVLTFSGALQQKHKQGDRPDGRPLHVYLTAEAGRWTDAWGESQDFNRALHECEVADSDITPGQVHLKLKLRIGSDNWVKGGPAEYEVNLLRKGEQLEGTFSGVFTGTPPYDPFAAQGRATGDLLPPQPVAAGYVPFAAGEHPRTLFRKGELAALRAKAQTPFGQAMIEKIKGRNDAVSLAFLYQLTGEKRYADQTYSETVKTMDNRNGGPFALGRFWGYRTSVVGAAYDLCYNAWTPEQREEVEDYLDWILYKCLHRQHRVGTVNWQPGSNYTVVIHAGNGIAALALWGEKGHAPVEPLPPRASAPRIAPPAGFTPANGAPVVQFATGKFPADWLWIGPFRQHVVQHEHPYYDYRQRVDCLATMGGMEKAQPGVGQEVIFKNQTLRWEPLSIAANPEIFQGEFQHTGRTIIKCYKLANQRENRHLFFYTVLENDKPGWYQFDGNFYEGKCFIAGQRILHGEHFYLEKGRFPLLVPVVMADGEYSCFFQFLDSSDEKAKQFYADPERARAYERCRQGYEEQLARWKTAGGCDLNYEHYADCYRRWCYLCLQMGMGDGGFQSEGEGYTLECHHVIHDYACAFQKAFGRSLTGRPDISHFASRYVFTAIPGEDGRMFQQSFGGHGGGTISSRYLARSIALCPKEWQPALLWHWLKLMGAGAEDITSGRGVARAFSGHEFGEGFDVVQAFINYPLDVTPQDPGEVLPHAWEAKTKGFYAFRNNWNGPESIVAQVYAKQGAAGWSQAEAGSFLIYGLGHEWAPKDNNALGKSGSRWLDNTVMLPDDPINAWGPAQPTFFHGDPRIGSGVVTFNMDGVYGGLREKGSGKNRITEEFDLGIRGLRSFAVDFSGRGGAPAVFAVVDRITGGKRKIWVQQLPAGATFSVEGQSFTLASGGATYKATVISPANAKIAKARGAGAQKISGVPDADRDAIHVTGPSGAEGDFFVVMTLQEGPAPDVSVQGDGLKATAVVGNVRLTFDGQKIVIGP
jgi:hypothetical protein